MVEDNALWDAAKGPEVSISNGLQRLDDLEAKLREISDRLDEQWAVVGDQGASLTGHGAWLADLQKWMMSTVQTLSAISTSPPTASPRLQPTGGARLLEPTAVLERQLRIWTVMTFLESAEVPENLLISVIVPTKNRLRWVERAIGSVAAQTYSNWELLVVDDASNDDTPAWLARLSEPRIRALSGEGKGAGAARNVGLDAASGNVVTYLDDDNFMHPGWLKGIAWAFSRWTDADTLYGARIIEDDQTNVMPGGAFPWTEFLPYDRDRLEQSCFIDQSVFAHRAGMPEARQDETLFAAHDWDVALKTTGHRPPLELPVVACIYTCGAPGRLSDTNHNETANRMIRSRVHTTRPFRVVAHNVETRSQSDLESDLSNLRVAGASVAVSGCSPVDGALNPDSAQFSSLEEAVKEFRPDLILLSDPGDIGELDNLGVPFALRLPSYDVEEKVPAEVRDHGMCVGIWAVGNEAQAHSDLSDLLANWRLLRA